MPGKNNLANYRKMSEPFADVGQANDAVIKFFELVEAARNECRVMDVHVIVKIAMMHDGEEGRAMTSAHFGNTLEAAGMCGWGLAEAQAELNAAIGKNVAGKQ